MYHSILNQAFERRTFNPTSVNDLDEVKYFLQNNRWRKSCPFYLEYPWLDIVSMCKDKVSRKALAI